MMDGCCVTGRAVGGREAKNARSRGKKHRAHSIVGHATF